MAPIWSKQPLKSIYTIFFLLKGPPQLLFLFLLYLVKPFRPLPEWGIKANLSSDFTKMLFQYITATQSQRLLYREPKEAKERHSHIEPLSQGVYSGVLTATETVKPGPVDAVWFPSPAPSKDETGISSKEKIVLHFPGGAFIMAFGHTDSGQEVADTMAKHMNASRTIWAQYRLAGTPETQFPAAIQDALTFYCYVLSLGIDPNNIILSGDSAGGNVVIALLRYLEESQELTGSYRLPLPGGAMVFSPWLRLTPRAAQIYTQANHARSDLLYVPLIQWGVDSYVPKGDLSEEVQSYVSPLHHPIRLSVPLFIHAGEAEGLYEDIKFFADEMIQLNGSKVRFSATPLAAHDLLLSHKAYGLTNERNSIIEEACEFLNCEGN